MQHRRLCCPPYFFHWPRSGPPTFFILESPLPDQLEKSTIAPMQKNPTDAQARLCVDQVFSNF